MKKRLLYLLLGLFYTVNSFSQVVINELDADTPSTDDREFVELKSSTPNFSLNGYVLVFYNGGSGGTGNTSYMAYDLDGITTNVNGIATIGASKLSPVPNRYLAVDGSIQNGPDAVALYLADGTDFPTGTVAHATNLKDALVYVNTGTTQASALKTALNVTVQYSENANGTYTTQSIQRKTDGTFEVKDPTPGKNNDGSGVLLNGISVSVNPAGNLTESNSFGLTFSTASTVTGSDLVLNYTLENGNFSSSDYTGTLTATIPVGSNSVSKSFTIVDDTENEGDEIMIIALASVPSNYEVLTSNIEVRVRDNDFIVESWGTPLNPTHGLVAKNIPLGYYNSLEGKSGSQLKQAIQDIIADPNVVREHTYADVWEMLMQADVNPKNDGEVWLMYVEQPRAKIDQHTGASGTGKWNREHIYCQSRGNFNLDSMAPNDGIDVWTTTDANDITAGGSDGHHLRAEDSPENSSRNNKNYGVDATGTDDYNGPVGTVGSWRGDVARSLFYMAVRYNGLNVVNGFPGEPTGNIGDLATLLNWNKLDVSDDFEMHHNNVIYDWQKNRNPFVDYPALADYVFGDKIGQTWSSTLSNHQEEILDVVMYPNPSNGSIFIGGLKNNANVEVYSMTGQKVFASVYEVESRLNLNLSSGIYMIKISEGNKNVTKKLVIK